MSLPGRFLAGICVYIVGWLGVILWNPHSVAGEVVKSIFFGSLNPEWRQFNIYTFPLVSCFGVYLTSTCLGEILGKSQQEENMEEVLRRIWRISLVIVSTAILLVVATLSGKSLQWWQHPAQLAWRALYGFQKSPPGPVFLMLYGGLGLSLLCILFRLPDTPICRKYIEITSLLGQTSFFVFVVQYYVYFVIFFYARLGYTVFWPAYLLVSAAFIIFLAHVWRVQGYNHLLTLRWKRFGTAS